MTTVTMPDGTDVEMPDKITPELATRLKSLQASQQPKTGLDFSLNMDKVNAVGQGFKDAAGGFARSGMGLVSNVMRPLDYLTGGSNDERMARVDSRFKQQGYDPNSASFQGAKLGGEVLATLPVGGLLAKGAEAIPILAKAAPALRSAGFTTGLPAATTVAGKVGQLALRSGAGAAVGGASTALVNPDSTGTGALIGGVLPGVTAVTGKVGDIASQWLDDAAHKTMTRALKPTLKMHQTGQAATAVQTMLDNGINATPGGVEKIQGHIANLNQQIEDIIKNSNNTVSRQSVMDTLDGARGKFMNQVDPMPDINAINGVADRFGAHPMINGDTIPVQQAQQLKQGTYRVLNGKYGEQGSASTEAQKALARGLKEQIAQVEPGVSAPNALESKFLDTLKVAQRRANMAGNNNKLGLSSLAPSNLGALAFMLDRNPTVLSLMARAANTTGKAGSNLALPDLIKQYGLLGAPSVIATSP